MRKLVLLVCIMAALSLFPISQVSAGIIPSWESPSGEIGFQPLCNELSLYQNYDDTRKDRGKTLQIVSINSIKLFTSFNFELTADYNFDFTPGMDNDHYVELSIVKPVTGFISLNIQRIISSFEDKPINQFGVRLSF